jgi:hypothetical protein
MEKGSISYRSSGFSWVRLVVDAIKTRFLSGGFG